MTIAEKAVVDDHLALAHRVYQEYQQERTRARARALEEAERSVAALREKAHAATKAAHTHGASVRRIGRDVLKTSDYRTAKEFVDNG